MRYQVRRTGSAVVETFDGSTDPNFELQALKRANDINMNEFFPAALNYTVPGIGWMLGEGEFATSYEKHVNGQEGYEQIWEDDIMRAFRECNELNKLVLSPLGVATVHEIP